MASVVCKLCNKNYAIAGCDTCKTLVCKDCSAVCQGCGTTICRQHVELTKKGRKLCGRCMSERNARREALRQKYSASRQQAPPAPTESAGVSFEDLMGSGGQLLKPVKPQAPPESEDEPDFGDPDLAPEEAEPQATFTETGKLELPPMDENRPVLGQSGYQPPSRKRVLAAFIFFGIGSMLFYQSSPILRELLFPFETTELKFNQGQMTQIQDTNKLRNAGNFQQLDILTQGPMFFVAWSLLIGYCGGVLILVVGMIRSFYWSRLANHNLEAARSLDKDNNELQ
ncbi:MAG: hypothetical protein VCD00_12915 [Candidatus Hydrogenedentota bacterium]